MYKKNIGFLLLIFCLFPYKAYVRDLGSQTTLSSQSCSYRGTYIKGSDYDTKPYIQDLEISLIKPYVLKVSIKAPYKENGAYYSLVFYTDGDEKYAPAKDLSVQPDDDSIADGSASIMFRTTYKRNKQTWAPVIYKKGFRGMKAGKETYLNYLSEKDPVTDLKGTPVGESGSFFTYLMHKNIGLGAALATKKGSLEENDKGYVEFLVNLNPELKNKIFVIASNVKISMIRSERGLRSPIRSSAFFVHKSC